MEQSVYTGKKIIYQPIKWDKFKVKYNIQIDRYKYPPCKTIEEKENDLKKFYNDHCNHLSTTDLSKITEEKLLWYKEREQAYINEVITNYDPEGLCNSSTYVEYILYCHVKEAFEYLESDFGHNMEDTIRINQQKEDKEFNAAVKQHQTYKFWYYFGLLAWMTSCFWGPFLFGIIRESINNVTNAITMDNLWVMGIAYVLAFSITMPVTIPLSFLIGAVVHPKILKSIIFTEEKPYCENLMKELNLSNNQERLNTASIATGTLLSKYLK